MGQLNTFQKKRINYSPLFRRAMAAGTVPRSKRTSSPPNVPFACVLIDGDGERLAASSSVRPSPPPLLPLPICPAGYEGTNAHVFPLLIFRPPFKLVRKNIRFLITRGGMIGRPLHGDTDPPPIGGKYSDHNRRAP